MVWVKVCGMTRRDDVELAGRLGASAVGFVFWARSPRHLSLDEAARLRDAVPPGVDVVGVFVNPSVREVREAVEAARLDVIQLHGDESLAFCDELPYPVMKAVAVDGPGSVERALAWPDRVRILLDVHDPARRGGTGQTVDWGLAAAIARQRPVTLAGGLTPANVVGAVEAVRPEGVDVSSGVERRPGVKDPGLVRDFLEVLSREGCTS